MFMKYHWYAKFSIKKQQTVDIHLIKAETVIFNGINFKINQIFWNLFAWIMFQTEKPFRPGVLNLFLQGNCFLWIYSTLP